MKHAIRFYGLLLIVLCTQGLAARTDFWQCVTYDGSDKQWVSQNIYQKMALNLAYADCKKESQSPHSCKASQNDCQHFVNGISTAPEWRCLALDLAAEPWRSNSYRHRDDAAFAAKAYCKENSELPDTCYVNMVTCSNLNSGVPR